MDQKTIEIISNEFEFDITEHLRFLNYISIHRKEANLNSFYNIGYILLTGNTKTMRVAWHELIKDEGIVPLATTLYWITNKFWFKLNKGFGDGAFPRSFDIVTKAQIILSHVLNVSVGEKYEELQNQFKEGKITEEQAQARIVNLRSQVRKPEEIEQDDISLILEVLSEDSLEQFIKEQELFKNEALKHAEENIKLKKELDIKEKAFKEEETARIAAQNERIRISIESDEKLLKEKRETIDMLEGQKKPIDKMANQKFRNFKLIIGGVFASYYVITYYLIWQYGWNRMEQWTFIVSGTSPIAISFFYLLIFEKTWNPVQFLKRKRKQFQQQKYSQLHFDINRLHKLEEEADQLEKKIANQKKQHSALFKSH